MLQLSLIWIRLAARSAQRDDDGQGLIEYALILSMVALTAFVALRATGTGISSMFNTVSSNL